MKRILVALYIAILYSISSNAFASLILREVNGQRAVYNDATDAYWYPYLFHLNPYDYYGQLNYISGLNDVNYFGLNTWHMATSAEANAMLTSEFLNGWADLRNTFFPSEVTYSSGQYSTIRTDTYSSFYENYYGYPILSISWRGRIDAVSYTNEHQTRDIFYSATSDSYSAMYLSAYDNQASGPYYRMAAWVVADRVSSVPEPTSILLVALGLVALSELRRKQ